jgi:hypothetical protein
MKATSKLLTTDTKNLIVKVSRRGSHDNFIQISIYAPRVRCASL